LKEAARVIIQCNVEESYFTSWYEAANLCAAGAPGLLGGKYHDCSIFPHTVIEFGAKTVTVQNRVPILPH